MENKLVMNKYEDWSKVLIEPQTLNDARLYTLETRVHEEEEIRTKEYQMMKANIQKLVYTLQEGVRSKELSKEVSTIIMGSELQQPSESKVSNLPELMVTPGHRRNNSVMQSMQLRSQADSV